jgi:hypothetical protein
LRDRSFAFHIWQSCFQRNDVTLLQAKFGRFFNCDNTLRVRNEAAHAVKKSCLASTCTATHDNVHSTPNRKDQKVRDGRRKRAVLNHVFHLQTTITESTN